MADLSSLSWFWLTFEGNAKNETKCELDLFQYIKSRNADVPLFSFFQALVRCGQIPERFWTNNWRLFVSGKTVPYLIVTELSRATSNIYKELRK